MTENHDKLFTAKSHKYGAMNLIKRLWCRDDCVSRLRKELGLNKEEYGKAMKFEDTRAIALEGGALVRQDGGKEKLSYIAVLAMDGDKIGEWLSGQHTPPVFEQFAPKAGNYLREQLEKSGREAPRRLLTPSYHSQFSEALANFAIHRAREIVEEHHGELLYAGGDDVLAILPSVAAIQCARKLREAFREDFWQGKIMPGSKCELSCGIAVGHHKAPLQMLVEEARGAEKRAKAKYGRGALAVNLYKRSGEILHWGCRWNHVGLELLERAAKLHGDGNLSGRFPYALAAFLAPYGLGKKENPDISVEHLREIIARDFDQALERQGGNPDCEPWKGFRELARKHLLEEVPGDRLEDFGNLFLVEAFINRSDREEA